MFQTPDIVIVPIKKHCQRMQNLVLVNQLFNLGFFDDEDYDMKAKMFTQGTISNLGESTAIMPLCVSQ